MKRSLLLALTVFLVLRISTSLVLAIDHTRAPDATWSPAPPCTVETAQKLNDLGQLSRLLLEPWERWDTCHYVFIAENGYIGNTQQTVWPPLYPMLTRMLDRIFSPALLAAIVVSNAAAFLTFWLFYLLVAGRWGEDTAKRAVILMAAFPTAFFLVAGYTESLFLALTMGVLLAVRRRAWLLAGALGFLAALTRNQGFLLAIPILWEGFRALRDQQKVRLGEMSEIGAAQLLPALAFAGFALYIHRTLGDPWPWQTLEKDWTLSTSMPWKGLLGDLGIFAGSPIPPGFNPGSIAADLGLTLLAIFFLIAGARLLPISYSLLGWATLLVGLVKVHETGLTMSMSRYALSVFPLFLIQGLYIKERVPFWAWVALNAVGQVVLLIAFSRWRWVA